MATKTIIKPAKSPTAVGPYNHAVRVGDLLFCAGQIPIDPKDGNRMIVSHDGGLSITRNRGKSWDQVQLPIAQIYHVTTDTKIPYYVYGNMQDGPSSRGPSNSRAGGISRGMWHSVGGGESGWATPDPQNPDLIWSTASGFGSVGGIVSRYDVLREMIGAR